MTDFYVSSVPTPIGKEQSEQLFSAWRPNNCNLISHCSGSLRNSIGTVGTVGESDGIRLRTARELGGNHQGTRELPRPVSTLHPAATLQPDTVGSGPPSPPRHCVEARNFANPHAGGWRHE